MPSVALLVCLSSFLRWPLSRQLLSTASRVVTANSITSQHAWGELIRTKASSDDLSQELCPWCRRSVSTLYHTNICPVDGWMHCRRERSTDSLERKGEHVDDSLARYCEYLLRSMSGNKVASSLLGCGQCTMGFS